MNPAAGAARPQPDLHPTLALLEVDSLAQGYVVADALVKAATIEFLQVEPVTPGKLLILYTGPVADVDMAHTVGLRKAGDDLIDQLFLRQADPQIRRVLDARPSGPIEALGLIECRTVAAGILAADAAAKASPVRLLSLRAARGIGGKTILLMTGGLSDVEASLADGAAIAERRGGLLRAVVVPQLHGDLGRFLTRAGDA